MNICIPKERRPYEFRVGLSPNGVNLLSKSGHNCYVEHNAGLGAGFTDDDYIQAGGSIVYSTHEIFGRADLILKVARPTIEEIDWMLPNTTIAGLLHLRSAKRDKIEKLLSKKITSIAYERIELSDGTIPIKQPLSAIGGRLSAQIAAKLIQNDAGGKGILLGGVPGVPPAEIVIIGAGIAGTSSAKAFAGMGAHITVLDSDMEALLKISNLVPGIITLVSNHLNIAKSCTYADVVVGAVLVPDHHPPKIVTKEMMGNMKERALLMDISIDEGGCFEGSHPTNHEQPVYMENGLMHYCVPNMPSIVARTSTHAFLNAAFPFILEIANKGVENAIKDNPAIKRGVGTHQGIAYHISQFVQNL